MYCCQESRTGSMRGIQENAKLLQAGLVRIRGWAYSQGEVAWGALGSNECQGCEAVGTDPSQEETEIIIVTTIRSICKIRLSNK